MTGITFVVCVFNNVTSENLQLRIDSLGFWHIWDSKEIHSLAISHLLSAGIFPSVHLGVGISYSMFYLVSIHISLETQSYGHQKKRYWSQV